jgi:lipopolysaccharide assembly outer membrane protein LptD (OstA)
VTPHRFLNLLLPLGLALACGATALAASPPPNNGSGGLQTSAYRIDTNETQANIETGDFTMPHKVRFYRPGTDAVGDRASGNTKRGTVSLFGNVVVHDSGNASEAGTAAYKGSGPATLTCNQLDVDSKGRVYTATGNFHFSQATRTGSADRATLDRTAGTLHLEGNVHLSDNGATVSANIIDYNLNTKDFHSFGNPTQMTQPVQQQAPPAARGTPPARRMSAPAPRRTPVRSPSPSPKPQQPTPKPAPQPSPTA